MRSFVIRERVEVDGEEHLIVMQVSAVEPSGKRDLARVRAEVKRLLPSWVKGKLVAGAKK